MTTWITATPPTPNGDLHVGHLAGPYLAGDVLRRFLGSEGLPVRYTTGLDDHQSYVPVRGLKDGGRKGEEVADGYGETIVQVWERAGITLDTIGRPRVDAGYVAYVQNFFRKLVDDGHIVPRVKPLPYCVPCDRWLYEAYVVGACPHCGARSNGNACEPCGRPNFVGDLVDPRCVVCGDAAELRDNERLFLPLEPFTDRLVEFWSTVDMPPRLRALCEKMLDDGLPEIAVSHPSEWGIEVPVAEFADQRIYVWFEMGPGYLLEHDLGGGVPESGPVQFFGIDNGYFHAVLFPASFLAYDAAVPLPRAFVVNEFYQLEGLKFSTSRRHAIWGYEALDRVGADVLRHHVLADRPNGRETSFSLDALARTADHVDRHWNGWLRRLFAEAAEEFGGVVPDVAPGGAAWELLRGRLTRTVVELRECYDLAGFDPRRAVALLDEVVALAADFGHVHHHDRARSRGRDDYRAALAGQLAVAAGLAAWAAPALPHGADRLAGLLGLPPGRAVSAEALAVPVGATLGALDGPVFGG
ncbi:hypothetical protein GCM10010492_45240 [Saccharothrix mutabilis subsp. mutabilis]|uniref:methionine--tRNA ligase n=1 Tax=Saccharothrix mutabilis subsp. mutabilis TaxID=66855 RepID=A0ABN0U797_9PSEU